MLKTIQGNLYDFPKYYDLVYGSDWKAEFDFLQAGFRKHATREVRRVYEPACGTGRLLVKFAAKGYEVYGADLNAKAVEYCNARLRRRGFAPTAEVADMCHYRPPKRIDAAFNTINSFRHLATERQARDHLACVAESLKRGGLYFLGLHLTPTHVEPMQEESWSARRGNLAVLSRLWVIETNRRKRQERVGMSFDVYTPTEQFRIEDEICFRTYSAPHLERLIKAIPEFEVTAIYDFGYNINHPRKIGPETEDVVFVLRKR